MAFMEEAGVPGGSPQSLPDGLALLARWNYSLAAFYVRRLQRQMELPIKLATATSPSQFMELRDAFQADLVADYSDQADALHRTCSDRGPNETADYGGALLKAQEHASSLIEQAKVQAERIIASARARADQIVAEAATGPAPSRRSAAG
jgi:cell division septum initiation protein DivIVA